MKIPNSRRMILNTVLFLLLTSQANQAVFGAKCGNDDECHEMYNPHYICDDSKCRRENLFPATTKESIGLFLLTLISAVANAGGLGGGAVIVPVYIFIFDYVTAESIPMSKATILAGALMNIFLIAGKSHPHNPDKFLVDYGLAGSMIPLLLAGTMIGVLLTKMLPPIVVVVLLSLYLFKSTFRMRNKAIRFHEQEEQESKRLEMGYKENSKKGGAFGSDENNGLLDDESQSPIKRSIPSDDSGSVNAFSSNADTDSLNTEEGVQIGKRPPKKITVKRRRVEPEEEKTTLMSIFVDGVFMMIAFLAILVVALLRGGHGVKSIIGIEVCSFHSWFLLFIAQIVCFICSSINKIRHRDVLVGREGSPEFETKNMRLNHLLLASYISGIGAGLLGIGGGMIMNPVMLDLGFLPEVSAAVAGFSVLFTSSSTTSQFVVAGAINFEQALYYLGFSSLGSLIGNIIIFRIVRKYNKPSILVWILFGLLFSSVLVLPTMGIYNIYRKGNVFNFNSPC